MKTLALLLPICLLAACREPPAATQEPIRPVKVMEVRLRAEHPTFVLPGDVRARWEAPWSFRVGGKLIRRAVEVGQRVAPGDLIGQLDDTDLSLQVNAQQAAVAAAEADAELARSEVVRVRQLFERKLVSQSERDQAERARSSADAHLRAARSVLDSARQQAGYARLIADEPGIVTAVTAEAGQVLAAGQPVVRVARQDQGRVEREIALALPESRLAALAGATLEVSALALPGRRWTGRLRELAPAADPATRTFAARIALDELAPELALGMSAEVRVAPPAVAEVWLPLTALSSQTDQPRVWRVDPANRVHTTPVILGTPRGDEVAVREGLAVGDRVVIAGAHLLREGLEVRPIPAETAP